MTREEAVKYIRCCMCEGRLVGNTKPIIDEKWQAGYMAIKALEQEPRWIPCSERLPAENTTVIGITPFDDIYKTELYDDCGEKKWCADGDYDVPIVAWMPLPQPYIESEDKL